MPNNKNVEATGNSFVDALLNRRHGQKHPLRSASQKQLQTIRPFTG